MNTEKIKQLEKRKLELVKKAGTTEVIAELRSINTELDTINAEIYELRYGDDAESEYIAGGSSSSYDTRGNIIQPQATETTGASRGQILSTYGAAQGQLNTIGSYQTGAGASEARNNMTLLTVEQMEQRGNDLKNRKLVEFSLGEMNFRSINVGTGTIVIPTHESSKLNAAPNEVSSVIDVVHSIPLPGGESYKSGFIVSTGEADYTTELADSHESDPVTDFVYITKTRLTTYFEMSSEVAKLGSAAYQHFAMEAARTAIRKKISKEILIGTGAANHLTGIFNAPANVIPTASDISIAAIDADTLDKLVFGYGGNENVEGGAYLFLNKQDLALFAAYRSSDGAKKLYKITLDRSGNSGTISSDDSYAVPFIINSACPALSATGTASGTYCMAYGKPMAYELALFSNIDVEQSNDFKFRSGMLCFKGEAFVGGNVAAYKGFARIKKA